MNWVYSVFVAVLFFLLTPGILLSLPPKSSKYVVAFVHAIVFAVVLHFSGSFISSCASVISVKEGVQGQPQQSAYALRGQSPGPRAQAAQAQAQQAQAANR
jgi:hypothetical protein